jgi:restriction system protein
MPIPDYQSMMLPILQMTADSSVHRAAEALDLIVQQFAVTDDEQQEMLPSGTAKKLYNRVHWALTYLRHAEVIRPEGRGRFVITDRGRSLLASGLKRIDKGVLSQFPEFVEFVGGPGLNAPAAAAPTKPPGASELTLEETLDETHAAMRKQFEQAFLHQIKGSTPEFFERLVIDVLVRMGYGGTHADAAKHLGGTGDGGVDGVIKEDKLGLESIYIQAKKWEGSVGAPVVQGFVGSLEGQHARKGVLITTATFSANAHQYVSSIEKRIVLIDGPLLVRLMLEHGVGIRVDRTYPVYSIDESYFAEEPAVL